MKWISVKKRTPFLDEIVLIVSNGKVKIAEMEKHFDNATSEWFYAFSSISGKIIYKNATHWMPLPDPPVDN